MGSPETEAPNALRPEARRGARLGGVARDEVVHGLLAREARHRRQHAERVAAQQDQVLRVRPHARYLCVVDVLDRV